LELDADRNHPYVEQTRAMVRERLNEVELAAEELYHAKTR
jgi:hypothetical protein